MTNYSLNDEICNTSERVIAFIQSQQYANGGFSEQTTFYAGLIANALENCVDDGSTAIKQKIASFLLRQKNKNWSYNYWQRNIAAKPYPDDLDDTFVALQAISIAMPTALTEQAWSCITKLLINNESGTGGPYQTWIMPVQQRTPAWEDVDIVVNSNIASFLLRFDIALPAMQEYFDRIIAEQAFVSKYYHDDIAILYFLAKAYRGSQTEPLKNAILSKRNTSGFWPSVLATAHAITALLILGHDASSLADAIRYMLDEEQGGSWPKAPLYIESRNADAIVYSDCDAYVSACCIEALQLHAAKSKTLPSKQDSKADQIVTDAIAECKKVFSQSNELLQDQLAQAIDVLLQKDPHSSVITMPYYFSQHMSCATFDVAQDLIVATVLGWIGYTIIDKMLDGEMVTDQLPLSAQCIRKSCLLFQSALSDSDHHSRVQHILDGIEQTVLWEHAACKIAKDGDSIIVPETLPDYGDYDCLARKSLGYALAPIILCLNYGAVEQAKIVEVFFRHYLIARQLNDDAHDWLDDLKQGFFNSVSVGLIQQWKTETGNAVLDLEIERKTLQELFWQKHIDAVCRNIADHYQEARHALAQLTIVTDTVFLEALLLPLEQSAAQALAERDKTKLFLYTAFMNNDDEINTNAEYEPIERLDEPEDENGEPVDPVELNQDEMHYEDEDGGSKAQLRRAIQGDDENLNDE